METSEMIPVMQAYLHGKTIQYKCHTLSDDEPWKDCTLKPMWDWYNHDYRVKPEHKIRPYANAGEFIKAQKEHGPYILEKAIVNRYLNPIMVFDNEIVLWFRDNAVTFEYSEINKETFYWQDGTPCGIIVE